MPIEGPIHPHKKYHITHARRALFFFCIGIVGVCIAVLLAYGITSTFAPAPASPTSTAPLILPTSTATDTLLPPIPHPVPTTTPAPIPIPTSPPPTVFTPSASLNYRFGISVGDTLPWISQEALSQELDAIASLGVGQVRLDLAWNDIQPNNGALFEWTNFDRVVAAANARHIKLLAILTYTPDWAQSPACAGSVRCTPANPDFFSVFVQAAVRRYAPQGISEWEVWNEPNLKASLVPATDARAYASLLKISYGAIKTIEPSSTVVLGGMGTAMTNNGNISPIDFLTELYVYGAKNYFDAVGFHPYSFPALPSNYQVWSGWSQMGSTPISLRDIMKANNDGNKNIWITEYGAPTDGPGALATDGTLASYSAHFDHVTEALQADMMKEAVTMVKNLPWTGPFFWYSYKDIGTTTNTSENFFGILRYDGSTKPVYTTLKNLLQ